MPRTRLSGVIAAIATPIDQTGRPDTRKFESLARHLLDNGCDGLNVLGTTGEATSFSVEQRLDVMRFVAASGLPTDRMMVGTGAAAVADATLLTSTAAEFGFAGALLLPPFYYKGVPAEGVVDYFQPIAAGSGDIPLYLYNFPALSGVPYTPELVKLLVATFGDRIAGLKDSSGDLDYARRVAAENPGLAVFPSNEATLLEARTGAFAGCISATANLNSAWCGRAFKDGDAAAHATAVSIRKLFDGKALVPGIKALLARVHSDPTLARVKPPMRDFGAADTDALYAQYQQLTAARG